MLGLKFIAREQDASLSLEIKVVSDSQLIRAEPIPYLGAGIRLVKPWESIS